MYLSCLPLYMRCVVCILHMHSYVTTVAGKDTLTTPSSSHTYVYTVYRWAWPFTALCLRLASSAPVYP